MMLVDLKPYAVGIGRGDGLVARFGDIVIYIADPSASADRLIAVVKSEADANAPRGQLARQLAALAFGEQPVPLAPFGVVAATDDGLHVLLYGKVSATIETAEGTHELSGARALTWVDEIVPASVRRIAITGSAQPGLSSQHNTDLQAGVVPGGGFDVRRTDAERAQPPRREPVSVPVSAPSELPDIPDVETEAFTRAKATAPQAPGAGSLSSDDGANYRLDRPYVIGRDPLSDRLVQSDLASPIVVKNDPHVSRIHAHVSTGNGRVFIRDAGTPAGTFIAAPGAEKWMQIGTAPTELPPEWSLRIGRLVLTYRTDEQP